MKRLIASAAALGLSFALSGCVLFPSMPQGVERLLVVQAMGIDAVGSGVELSMVSSADSSRGEGPVRVSGRGVTISDAQRRAGDAAADEELFCAHTRYFLVGETTAAAGLGNVLGFICRSPEIRIDVPVFVVRGGSAKDALLKSGGGRAGAAEILSALADGSSLPGLDDYSCARVSSRLAEGKSALVYALELVPSSEQPGQADDDGELMTLSQAGFGVIKGGRLVAFVEPEDAVAVDLICGAKGVHELVVGDELGSRVTFTTAPADTALRAIRGGDGSLCGVAIDVSVRASVLESEGGGDLADGDYRAALETQLERELVRRIRRVLRLERELETDFLALGERAGLRLFDTGRGGAAAPAALRYELSVAVSIDHSNDVRGSTA